MHADTGPVHPLLAKRQSLAQHTGLPLGTHQPSEFSPSQLWLVRHAADTAPEQAPQKPGADEAAVAEGAGAVVGMPKVALLFLTRGHLPHEPLWAAWFRTAAGASLGGRRAAVCGPGSMRVWPRLASAGCVGHARSLSQPRFRPAQHGCTWRLLARNAVLGTVMHHCLPPTPGSTPSRQSAPSALPVGLVTACSAGQLRADCLGATLCGYGPRGAESALINLQQAEAGIPASDPIARQSMFSVLVHAPPVFRGCAELAGSALVLLAQSPPLAEPEDCTQEGLSLCAAALPCNVPACLPCLPVTIGHVGVAAAVLHAV